MNKIHYRDSDLSSGEILIDRPIDNDLIIVTSTLISAAESRRQFLPVIRIKKIGYIARNFSWWPFGRKTRINIQEVGPCQS